jgi:hypothetical protein
VSALSVSTWTHGSEGASESPPDDVSEFKSCCLDARGSVQEHGQLSLVNEDCLGKVNY